MLRGIYSAGTAMITQSKKMNVISNNIANATTTGFKEDQMISQSFKDVLISRNDDSSIVNVNQEVGPYNNGIHIDSVLTSFLSGAVTETGKSTDLAITGDGFFAVQTPQGERYTRDGAFCIDSAGYLANQDGQRVLGQNGAIYVGTDKFTVKQDGEISVNNNTIDKLKIVNFANSANLRKEGNNLYTTANGETAMASNATVKQGSLEASNIDMVKNVTSMLEVYRNYESNQKVIQILDGTLDKAVNDIGKI